MTIKPLAVVVVEVATDDKGGRGIAKIRINLTESRYRLLLKDIKKTIDSNPVHIKTK